MGSEDKTLVIYIKNKNEKDSDKPVPVSYVAETYLWIQNLLCHITDDIEDNPTREGGCFPSTVKEQCELVIQDFKIGSAISTVALSQSQTSLPGTKTVGEIAMERAHKILAAISHDKQANDVIETEIKNSNRRGKVLKEMEKHWPGKNSTVDIKLKFGTSGFIYLYPERKTLIQSMTYSEPISYEKVFRGRLDTISVDSKRRIHLDTPDGKITCKYEPELESTIIGYTGKFVQVHGMMTEENNIKLLHISNEKSIMMLETMPMEYVLINSKMRIFKEPLPVSICYENERYVASDDKLGLLVTAVTMVEVFKGLGEELEMLWNAYVMVSKDGMSKDALLLRTDLVSLFKE
ncbi:hypothetical protein [Methanocella sp. MCL-LM]|uniref:hypothetical protein n=1 Tax=Methanocella sp. MCL-LM TaxID=3412035 RepID=UPI003C762AB4